MDQGLSRATNAPTAKGDRLARKWRVAIPAARGSTTYNTVDRTSVSQGTVTLVTPSKNAAMGAKATTITRSFTETCTSV